MLRKTVGHGSCAVAVTKLDVNTSRCWGAIGACPLDPRSVGEGL